MGWLLGIAATERLVIGANILITTVGFLATAVSTITSPAQVANVVTSRRNLDVLNGVSAGTILFILSTSALWASYGFRFGALWTGVIAVLDIALYLVILIILAVYAGKWRLLLSSLTIFLILLAVATVLSQTQLGIAGATVSTVRLLPQCVRVYRLRGTAGVYGFSLVSAVTTLISSVLWFIYAVLISDVWIAVPVPLSLVATILIIVIRLKGTTGSQRTAPKLRMEGYAHANID